MQNCNVKHQCNLKYSIKDSQRRNITKDNKNIGKKISYIQMVKTLQFRSLRGDEEQRKISKRQETDKQYSVL